MIRSTPLLTLLTALSVTAVAATSHAAAVPDSPEIVRSITPDGVEYAYWNPSDVRPAPTLIVLSGDIDRSLTHPSFLNAGKFLGPQGWLCVSIDLPCHGEQATADLRNLSGWAKRVARGEDIVAEFNTRMRRVVDHLITQGLTDPERLVASGVSRGGFMAIRYAAFDDRVDAAIGYAPVTDLAVLREFDAIDDSPAVKAMSLHAHAEALVGRPIFLVIGDRDTRVGTDDAMTFMRRLQRLAAEADTPSRADLYVVSEPRGHATHPEADGWAARWVRSVLADD